MNYYNDKISEKYRKYIIRVTLSNEMDLYLLWGTDLGDEDKDKLLIDNEMNILAFRDIPSLLNLIRNYNVTFKDKDNLIEWSNHLEFTQPFAFYNIYEISKIVKENEYFFNDVSEEKASQLIDFYNVFSDYAYQVNLKQPLAVIQEKSMKMFFDYIYDFYFWDKEGRMEEIKRNIKNFNYSSFAANYKKMISIFEDKIREMN